MYMEAVERQETINEEELLRWPPGEEIKSTACNLKVRGEESVQYPHTLLQVPVALARPRSSFFYRILHDV